MVRLVTKGAVNTDLEKVDPCQRAYPRRAKRRHPRAEVDATLRATEPCRRWPNATSQANRPI